MDRWENFPLICKGGLRLDLEKLEQGTNFPGTASTLQNYEATIEGGYRRIKGYTKYDDNALSGSGPILAVRPALDGVFAVRKVGTDNQLFYSNGAGWGSALNTTARTGSPTKARILPYNIYEEAICLTDGVNPAGKYNGSTYTHLNGTGAPTAPKYSEIFKKRLVLAPGSTESSIVLSSPNDDEDFDAANGAIEINTGDKVKGIKSFREILYIFCENSIYKLVGSSSADFEVQDVAKRIGCLGHDTIQEIGGDLIYLSQSGLRSLAATERFDDIELSVVSRGIHKELRNYLSLDESAYSSAIIRDKSQYRLFIYESSVAKAETFGFIGTLTDTPIDPQGLYEWAITKGIQATSAESNFDQNSEIVVMGDASDGYVYVLESGNSFDGDAIEYVFQTPYITFGNATLRKVLHKVDMYLSLNGTINADFKMLLDYENAGVLQPLTKNISSVGSVASYNSAVYGVDTYSLTIDPVFKNNVEGSGFVVAFRIFGSDSNAPHRIDSLDITYAPKGRR